MRLAASLGLLAAMTPSPAQAQQFVTDNYITMPQGTVTTCCSIGQRETIILPSISLFPNWEFFAGATLIRADEERGEDDHFQTDLHVKWQFYENDAANGGLAMQLGTGSNPGYLSKEVRLDSLKTYHYILMGTVPFLDGKISWDLNPGLLYTKDVDNPEVEDEWQFTYATRLAIYSIVPSSALVGEVYGTEGDNAEEPGYKAGIRWEKPWINVSLTYGWGEGDGRAAGLEIGMLLYSKLF
jgi:hypothetical protein